MNERIRFARRTSYSLMNIGPHGLTGLNTMTPNITYKAYVLPCLLYGLEVLILTKGRLNITYRRSETFYHSSTYFNLGCVIALPLETELHKRRLSPAFCVINSENPTLKSLVQRQLACPFNTSNSFKASSKVRPSVPESADLQ